MKTEAIRNCIAILQEAPSVELKYSGKTIDSPDTINVQGLDAMANDALAELTALEAENAAMVGAIEAAMRIEDLWCPEDEIIRPENANEMRALAAMKAGLEASLSPPTGKVLDTTNYCPICEARAKEQAGND